MFLRIPGWIQAIVFVLMSVPWLACHSNDDGPAQPSKFDLPRTFAVQNEALSRAISLLQGNPQDQQLREAKSILTAAVRRMPDDYRAHYHLAAVHALAAESDSATAALELALEHGFRDAGSLRNDPRFQSLRETVAFRELLLRAMEPIKKDSAKPTPARAVDRVVTLDEPCVQWASSLGLFRAFVEPGPETAEAEIARGKDEAAQLLRQWAQQGTAAGNHGDFYDNHDRDHSNLRYGDFPQLTRIEYSEAAQSRNLNNGLQQYFLFDGVTIGNSSTALTSGVFWRSQGRFALTRNNGPMQLYLQYRSNQLYFYPEHRDHDPAVDRKGHGDVFPANTPYLILSQGSSGSDREFMHAVARTLAAFRPEVKSGLKSAGLLMPVVQMIFRRSNLGIESDKEYLSGKAHPTVFEGKKLDPARMVKLAQSMTLDRLPPFVQIQVVEEDPSVLGRDYFDYAEREKLFDTPCAIARVVKSTQYQRRMVVAAQAIQFGKPQAVTLHWKILRGDPARITIRPLNEQGTQAEIIVSYHERRDSWPVDGIASNRVDVGVFASNEHFYSPPAFVSLYYLANERREYDQQQRIRVVDYADPTLSQRYVDPLLDARKDWRDEYHYSADGQLTGWTRIRGSERESFDAQGRLIVRRGESGQPLETALVRYVPKQDRKQRPVLKQIRAVE